MSELTMNSKQIAFAVMIFLILIGFGDLLWAEYLPNEVDMSAHEKEILLAWYPGLMEIMGEPTLWSIGKDPKAVSLSLCATV